MEGLNLGAFFAGAFAILVFGITSLVALGLLIARYCRAARIVFAAGLLGATIIMALAMLSFLAPEFRHGASMPLILVTSGSLLLAGAGQFIAALRSARTFAAAFGCAAVALALMAAPLLGGDWAGAFFGDLLDRTLPELGLPLLLMVSLIPATASVAIAVFLPLRVPSAQAEPPRQAWPRHQEDTE